MKVQDIMTRNPSTANTDSTIEEIATLMKEEDVGAIPIIDEDQDLAGIVTDRDIVLRCIATGRDPSECKAEDIIAYNTGQGLHTIAPDADIEEAARIMAEHQVRRLPVVEEGRLVGMLSIGDLAVKSGGEEVTGETLEEVSKGVKGQSQPKRKGSPSQKSVPGKKRQGITNRALREEKAAASYVPPRVKQRNVTKHTVNKRAS